MTSCLRDGVLLWRPQMQAAFGLLASAPPAGPRVFAGEYRRGAGPAPDARIATLVQDVERHVVRLHVGAHVREAPPDEGADFREAEFSIPAKRGGIGPVDALLAA